jgi:hypothetical protein
MCPEQLRLATLDHNQLAQSPENQGLVFYRGKQPADGKPFSFVPCRPVNSASELRCGHPRVSLERESFRLTGITQGCAKHEKKRIPKGGFSMDVITEFWNKIVDECHKQKFNLGHTIELPTIETARGKNPLSEPFKASC